MPLNGDEALVLPPNSAYEFDATATDDPGPAPSSDAPGPVKEPPVQSGDDAEPERDEQPPEFDPRYKQPFVGLLYVGYLEATFTFMHHRFKIATPTRRERIEMGRAISPFQSTATAELAYQTALVAAYLVEIDGEKLPEPVLNNSKVSAFMERFEWVSDNVQDPVMDEVYSRCMELDAQVVKTLEAMGKASG